MRAGEVKSIGNGLRCGNPGAVAAHHQSQAMLSQPARCAIQCLGIRLPQMETAENRINGCVFNRLQHCAGTVLQSIKDAPIYSILGGFHLWQADTETLDRTASWLGEHGLGLMMGGHCTGIAAAETIANRLNLPRSHISHAAIGSVITPA